MKNLDILQSYYGTKMGTTAVVQTPADHTLLKFLVPTAAPVENGPSRKELLEEFLQRQKMSSGPEMAQQMTEHCNECNCAREELPTEGILVCPKCGSEE